LAAHLSAVGAGNSFIEFLLSFSLVTSGKRNLCVLGAAIVEKKREVNFEIMKRRNLAILTRRVNCHCLDVAKLDLILRDEEGHKGCKNDDMETILSRRDHGKTTKERP